MRALLVLIGCLLVGQLLAQKSTLIAEKRNRQLSFVEGKRYTFSYFDGDMIRTQKGVLTIIQDSILQIKGRKQTVEFPLSRLHGVYHYRHWSSVVYTTVQSVLGATVAYAAFRQQPIGWQEVLYGIFGITYFADGIFSMTGVQTIGVLGPNPSIARRFTFRIQH